MTDVTTEEPTQEPNQETTQVEQEVLGNRYPRRRPFLVIEMIGRPTDKVRSEVAGWNEKVENWAMFESVSIVDRVNNTQLIKAAVIIDVLNKSTVKNRFRNDMTDEKVVEHFLNRYADKVMEGLRVWKESLQAG